MRNGITHLYIPGPTNIPEAVRQAMNVPMQDMRAADFGELTKPLFEGVRKVFKAEAGRVFLFPSSGSGAWEAAMTNTLSPGDRVLMASYGQFSQLWVQMAASLGLQVECLEVPWGEGVPLEAYEQRLKADRSHAIKAVFVTHNETATGVTSDVAGVRAALDAAGHPALLFVDGVSSIGSIDFRQDDWGVDLAVAGSQKGFMLPAGLSLIGVSDKALEASKGATLRRCYFDFADMAKMNAEGFFPYTPPTQLFHGLKASLALLFEEGLDQVFARHARLAEGVRRGVAAWGLELCAAHPRWYSDTVSAVRVPAGVDAREVIRLGYQRYRTSFGSGLGPLAGKVFRIGHLGDLNEVMCLAALASAEMALLDAGADLEAGSGVAAAQAWYREAAAQQVRLAAE
ncbi:serine-glyoxylate aminotransferase apoenzyme [Tistlia consotensis]|uniref:Serine-glyoxylate aminotransferase apoenzyme n=1 Tax=Tistlia consotensis USBA 355 TaxID=560819 RepID=A0A1Y6BJN8_9PROT|nr:aminotransferase class V-fold PLP-dependent enzyme [Tistlia consotensis]SMF11382.1 serine-glyoxylate aminotransferase apoenzyme [Tistlia consotensis USBA 355]SNR52011.1 serine-glyoxylate aminotransferase apoenzyme [Tistlia consotensis]